MLRSSGGRERSCDCSGECLVLVGCVVRFGILGLLDDLSLEIRGVSAFPTLLHMCLTLKSVVRHPVSDEQATFHITLK